MNGDLQQQIEDEVLRWPGISKEPGRFNSISYRYGKREIGHVHRNGVADFAFPRVIHDELIRAGNAHPHQAGIPGGVSVYLHSPEDVSGALTLFRLNYERAQASANQSGAH